MTDESTNEQKEQLTEVELLKLKLANLEIDNLELQSRLVETQHKLLAYQNMERKRQLDALSRELKEKYNLNSPEQVNILTGEITRND